MLCTRRLDKPVGRVGSGLASRSLHPNVSTVVLEQGNYPVHYEDPVFVLYAVPINIEVIQRHLYHACTRILRIDVDLAWSSEVKHTAVPFWVTRTLRLRVPCLKPQKAQHSTPFSFP